MIDTNLIEAMEIVREKCSVAHRLRKKLGIPLRQPLKAFYAHLTKKEKDVLQKYISKT